MSRIGKQPIKIPEDVEIKKETDKLVIRGPKGELARVFNAVINIEVNKDQGLIKLTPQKDDYRTLALWGTFASHIKNMIEGVTKGFSKSLVVEGVGYKVQLEDSNLVMSLGFSHPVKVITPNDLQVTVEKNKIEVSGIDKEKVGTMAAKIRAFKKPEPYKGKGIRYEGEIIRRKAGKKAAGTT